MTRVRIEDLPPKLRKQLERKVAEEDTPDRPGDQTKGGNADRAPSLGRGPRYRCHTCGVEFERYGAQAERHADEHHGARLEAIL